MHEVRALDRTGADRTARFDRIVRAASALPVSAAVLDGVAVDRRRGAPDDLVFQAFDLLHLDGYDLRESPLEARKALLAEALEAAPSVLRYSSHVRGAGEAFLREACRLGAPGVVSKRTDAPYAAGEGGDWREVRCRKRSTNREPRPSESRMGSGKRKIAGVSISHPNRVLFPDARITKSDLGLYWEAVAEVALPNLTARPLTLVRCPQGIGSDDCFYQKHAGQGVPETVPRIHVPEKDGDPKAEPYMHVDGLVPIVELVQLGTIEFHVWNARVDRLDRPDTVVMDVDPGPGVPWSDVVGAGILLREMLSELGLESWPRATGGKGLHVVVPMTRRHGWSEVREFARALAETMARTAPDHFVSKAAKRLREGRIYVDWQRNGRNATAIGTFSPRARPGAPIAFPLSWEEAEETGEPPRLSVSEAAGIDWSSRDAWHGYGDVRQSITRKAREALGLE